MRSRSAYCNSLFALQVLPTEVKVICNCPDLSTCLLRWKVVFLMWYPPSWIWYLWLHFYWETGPLWPLLTHGGMIKVSSLYGNIFPANMFRDAIFLISYHCYCWYCCHLGIVLARKISLQLSEVAMCGLVHLFTVVQCEQCTSINDQLFYALMCTLFKCTVWVNIASGSLCFSNLNKMYKTQKYLNVC